MYLAYLDESGDRGWKPGASDWFVLSCTLIHETHWLQSLDNLIALRRGLNNKWHIPVRAELKAKHFRSGQGVFSGLNIGLRNRMNIYKDIMEYQASNLNSRVFAVAVDKWAIRDRTRDARLWAWTFALQRIDRFCTDQAERALILPDTGYAHFIRGLLRQMRRIHSITGHYGGQLNIPVRLVIEDPADRHSHESYFIQMADLNAYAARRSHYIEPKKKVRPDLWDKLTPMLLLDVNRLEATRPPGIVKWP